VGKALMNSSGCRMLCGVCAGQSATGWPVYNGGLDGDHYSPLKQINRANVQQLKVAWSFDTGEKGGIQTIRWWWGGRSMRIRRRRRWWRWMRLQAR
jgi:hypothetical protein